MWLMSVVKGLELLGLTQPVPLSRQPRDISDEALSAKVKQHLLAQELGATKSVRPIQLAALTAVELDAYWESAQPRHLTKADQHWQELIDQIPERLLKDVSLQAAVAASYFLVEETMRRRIANGNTFLWEEVITYLFQRGSDSLIYASLLRLDGIEGRAHIAAFRALQALEDIEDDLIDLESDRNRCGANMLLMVDDFRGERLVKLAQSCYDFIGRAGLVVVTARAAEAFARIKAIA